MVFTRKISLLLGFGAICFLELSLFSLIAFSYSNPPSLFLGIQTANAGIRTRFVDSPPVPPLLVVEEKSIFVSLKDQSLTYVQSNSQGIRIMGSFKISSGLAATPTPPGQYTVLKKKPLVNYRGANYNFPNTKWNLMFKEGNPLNYYIHGAYWHNNFGHPMSHGCINVSYADMEGLYNWADEGTKIFIY